MAISRARDSNGRFVSTGVRVVAVDDASPVLKKIEGKASKFVTNITNKFKKVGGNILQGFLMRIGEAPFNAFLSGLSSLKSQLIESSREAVTFQRALMEVRTLGAEGGKALADAADRLAQTYGSAPVEQVKAYYQAISAGAQDGADALGLLEQANKLAKGGLATVGASVDGLVSLMNAFGLESKDAAGVVDALFVAMKKGITTVPELVESVGRLSGSAKAVGLSFDEMLAAVSAVTTQGIKTNTAVDFLNSAMVNLIKPTKEAKDEAARLGIEFSRRGIKAAGGFAQFLQKIANNAKLSDESLGLLFGSSEAMRAMMALMNGDMAKFNENLEAMQNKAGAADEANREMSRGMQDLMKKAEGAQSVLSRTFGDLFTDSESAKRGVDGVTKAFQELTRFLKSPDGKAAGEAFFSALHRGAIVAVDAVRSVVRGLATVSGSKELQKMADELYEVHKALELSRQGRADDVSDELMREIVKRNVSDMKEIAATQKTLADLSGKYNAEDFKFGRLRIDQLKNEINQRKLLIVRMGADMAWKARALQEELLAEKKIAEVRNKTEDEKKGGEDPYATEEYQKSAEEALDWLREMRTRRLEVEESYNAMSRAVADANRRVDEEGEKGHQAKLLEIQREANREKLKEERAAAEKAREIENVGGQMASGLVSSIKDLIDRTKTLKDVFNEMAIQLLTDLAQIIAKMAIVSALKAALGVGTGGAGFAGGGIFGLLFGGLFGFNKGGMVPGFAHGGVIGGGQPGRDSVLMWGTPGEVVIPAPVVDNVRRGLSAGGNDTTSGGNTYVTVEAPSIQTLVPPTSRVASERIYESSLNPSWNRLTTSRRIRQGNWRTSGRTA